MAEIRPKVVESGETLPAIVYGSEYINNEISCTETIYILEGEKGLYKEDPDFPTLVIGGRYGGSSSETFYRVDFANQQGDSEPVYFPVIRNFIYTISIDSVSGPGYSSAADARSYYPVNMFTGSYILEEFTLGVSDGQYILKLTQGGYELRNQVYNQNHSETNLNIQTNHPDGWRFTGITYEDSGDMGWLRFCDTGNSGTHRDNDKGGQGELSRRRLWLDDYTPAAGQTSRVANLHFTAGRIEATIRVEQLARPSAP
ncbi:MAG: hypothetical protein LUD15_09695 [Bacteroides sp.]|nr:hypothetical protein [Bacteroides sp.]